MGKWHFSCGKTGHEENPDFGVEVVVVSGNLYEGRCCRNCGCPYFTFVGKPSAIVGPGGGILP